MALYHFSYHFSTDTSSGLGDGIMECDRPSPTTLDEAGDWLRKQKQRLAENIRGDGPLPTIVVFAWNDL